MTTTFRNPRFALASIALACITILPGCGLLVVGSTAATTAIVATDRRTTGEQVEDQAIELKAAAEMRRLFEEDAARVHPTSYAGRLLLTGDVPTEQAKQQAGEAAAKVEKVKQVYNELRVGAPTALSVRTNDTWLTSKVKTALINTKEVPSRTIAVTTERGVVYLLGKVTQEEGQRAAAAAASVKGVNKVVKLFEIVAAESLITDPVLKDSDASAAAPQSAPSTDTDSGVEVMPVQ